jgi:hypothetical protein
MSTAADAVIAKARSHINDVHGANDCAIFVSQVFAETGHGSIFGSSSWVPTIVGRFSGGQVSGDQGSAQLADLIVFGPDKAGLDGHIAIYIGNGDVIGTNTGSDGRTTVQKVSLASVRTNAGTGFSKVLHTGLAAGTSTLVLPLGSLYRGTTGTFDQAAEDAWLRGQLAALGMGPSGSSAAWFNAFNTLKAAADPWVGKPYASLPDTTAATAIQSQGTDSSLGAQWTGQLGDAAGTLFGAVSGAMFGWVPGFALNAGLLLFAAGLVWVGMKQVVGSVESEV